MVLLDLLSCGTIGWAHEEKTRASLGYFWAFFRLSCIPGQTYTYTVYVYTCISLSLCRYIYIYLCVFLYMYIGKYIYIYICVYVCVFGPYYHIGTLTGPFRYGSIFRNAATLQARTASWSAMFGMAGQISIILGNQKIMEHRTHQFPLLVFLLLES